MKLPPLTELPKPEEFVTWLNKNTWRFPKTTQHRELPDTPRPEIFSHLNFAFSQLPIPTYMEKDYWDQIPQENISTILEEFCYLIYFLNQCRWSIHASDDYYQWSLLTHTLYAVADKLIRRSHPELKNFASPFFLLHGKIKFSRGDEDANYQFPILPMAGENSRWDSINQYFQQTSEVNKNLLFAFNVFNAHHASIQDGLDKISKNADTNDPVACHLKFLAQFIDKQPELEGHKFSHKYCLLWENKDGKYLGSDFRCYHYIAHTCWQVYNGNEPKPEIRHPTKPICSFSENNEQFYVVPLHQERMLSSFQSGMNAAYIASLTNGIKSTESENAAMCLPSKKEIPAHLQRDWARIAQFPSLQITSTIQWVIDHLPMVKEASVKNEIERNLLAPHCTLIKRLKAAPHLAERLRHMIDEGIKFYGEHPNEIQHLLFFLRLGIALESHIEKSGLGCDMQRLGCYEKKLLMCITQTTDICALRSLYECLRYLYAFALPNKQNSLKEMIKAGFWLEYTYQSFKRDKIKTWSPPWVEKQIRHLEDRRASEIFQAQLNPTWVNEVSSETFKLLFPNLPVIKEAWQVSQSKWNCQDYVIDPVNLIIYRGKEQLWLFDPLVFYSCHLGKSPPDIKEALKKSDYRFWVSAEGVVAYDNSYQFHYHPNEFEPHEGTRDIDIHHKLSTEKGSFWYRKVQVRDSWVEELLHTSKGVLLQRVDNQDEFIMIDEKKKLPLYSIEPHKKAGFEVRKFNAQGKRLPYRLLDPNSLDSSFFTRLGLKSTEALCWLDDSGSIPAIDLPKFDLRFEKRPTTDARLWCCNFPDFFLSPTQTLPGLESFKGGLILENALGEKRVVIAAHKMKRDDTDFTTEITMGVEPLVRNNVAYFLYRFDESSSALVNEAPEANWHLALLFAAMRDYTAALRYLELSLNNRYFSDFFENISFLKDESPEGLAFLLRAALALSKNHSQVLIEGYGTQGKKQDFFLKAWIERTYTHYLRYASSHYSRIPQYIRLKHEEELELIKHLERHGDLAYVIQSRKRILMAKRILKGKSPCSYTLSPSSYQAVLLIDLYKTFAHGKHPNWEKPLHPFDPAFVRMRLHEVKRHFAPLFERAKKGKGELDTFYLARSSEYESDEERDHLRAYAHLLHIVRTNAWAFKEFTFGIDANQNRGIFNQIVNKAIRFQGYPNAFNTFNVFETTVHFDYTAEKTLELPKEPKLSPLSWKFGEGTGETLVTFQKSLQKDFLDTYCKTVHEPAIRTTRAFPLQEDALPFKATPTMKRIIKTFRKGYRACLDPQKTGNDCFSLKDGKTVQETLAAAEALLKKKKEDIEELKTQAETLANSSPPQWIEQRLRQTGRDLPKITLEGILTDAVDAEDPNILRAANPALTPQEIEKLLETTMRYHILRCHQAQLVKAIKALTNNDVQAFGEALAVYGAFDPVEDPSLLIYQSRMQLIARKEQGEFVEWLKKAPLDGETNKLLLFEFAAGGGKGTFFTPILKKLARKKGLMPVSTSPASLYQVELKKQRAALKRAYHLNLEVLEIALNTQATGKDFAWIYEKLVEFSKNDSLKIIPEAYNALELKYQQALDEEDDEKVDSLSKILLEFFPEKCAGFIDEGRMNLSPLTQAKIGIGKPKSLPSNDRALFVEIYQALVEPKLTLKDGRKVSDIVRLCENKQALMSKDEREEVRIFLIQQMLNNTLLNIPEKEKQAIENWWLKSSNPKPAWLINEIKKQTVEARRIVEVAEYCHNFYDFCLNTVGKMRHMHSMTAGEEIHTPARKGKPTRSYFEEPYVALVLTIQGTLQTGLTQEQCAKLIDLLQETRRIERASTQNPEIDTLFAQWIGKEPLALADLSSKNSAHVEQIHKLLHKNTDVIFWYLKKVILEQVTYSSEQLVVTPQHFLHAFKMCTVYSAFLGPVEAYGFYPPEELQAKLLKRNAAFAAQVVHELGDQRNQNVMKATSFESPYAFFKQLYDKDPELLKKLDMVIDVNGLLRDFTTEEIAKDYFKFLATLGPEYQIDGIMLFQDASDKEEESDLMIWLKDRPEPIVLPEGDVVSGFAALGYKWEDLKLFTIIDPSHATGADVLQKEDAVALLLLGEMLTLGDLIQGVMRLRGFLKKQKVIWCVMEKLANIIAEECKECTPESILFWALKNEAIHQEKEIILSAYQQMDYIVQKPARAELKKHLGNPKAQIAVWKKYRKGFVKKFVNDPLVRFVGSDESDKTRTVLEEYAKKEYARYGYASSLEQQKELQKELSKVYEKTSKRIAEIPTKRIKDLGQETQLHCHQHQHLKQEQEKLAYTHVIPENSPALDPQMHLYQPNLVGQLTSLQFSTEAQPLFKSKGFTENLHFTHKLIRTAKAGGKSLNHTFLKPAYYFLVVCENDKLHAIALSNEEADFFQAQLEKGETWLTEHKQTKFKVNRAVALFSADGTLVQNGPAEIGFSVAQLNKIKKQTWFTDVVLDIGLVSCMVRDLIRFCQRAEKWKDFSELWSKIKTWQPNPEAIHTHLIDSCIASTTESKKSTT